MADERHYLAYMVRLWTVHQNGDLVWRASAENAHTGDAAPSPTWRGCATFCGGGGGRAARAWPTGGRPRGKIRGGLKRFFEQTKDNQ